MNANLKILVEKDMENVITITEIDMKVTLLMEIILATEYIILLQETNTKDILNQEYIHGLFSLCIKAYYF